MRSWTNERDEIHRKIHDGIPKRLQKGKEAPAAAGKTEVVDLLAMGQPLPERNRDHALTGDWVGHRECHIQPDWLLIYRVEEDVLVLTMTRTGTHSELFG